MKKFFLKEELTSFWKKNTRERLLRKRDLKILDIFAWL